MLTISGGIKVPFRWALGAHAMRFFQGLMEGRILGGRCPSCKGIIVPPLPWCGECRAITTEFVEVGPQGTALAPVPYMLEFPGQTRKPPFWISPIMLDKASTSFMHLLDGMNKPGPGLRVEPVWKKKEEREGNMEDIVCFRPIAGQGG